jgi:hypothetical protein
MHDDISIRLNDNIPPTAPTEEELIQLLERSTPKPTANFYQRASEWPWVKGATPMTMMSQRHMSLRFISGAAVLLVLIGVIVMTPSLRAMAAEFLGLTRASDNNIERTLTYTDPVVLDSIAEAEARAGFDLREPTLLPPGYTFSRATYWPDKPSVMLTYTKQLRADNPNIVASLDLIQWRGQPSTTNALPSVGQDADVEIVQVGDVQGQYVIGAWKTLSRSTSSPESGTMSEELRLSWDRFFPLQRVRWTNEGTTFDLQASISSLSKEELVEIAASLE